VPPPTIPNPPASPPAAHRINWRLPVIAALGALVIFLPDLWFGNGGFQSFLVLTMMIVFTLLLLANAWHKRQQGRSAVLMVAAYAAVLWIGFLCTYPVRTATRWLFWKKDYKAQTLAQPQPQEGELQHMEWDAWGFPGEGDSFVFLVYDPKDTLAAAVSARYSGKFNGIPCQVPHLIRMESQWYLAQYYPDTSWNECSKLDVR
jgi:hypothetical protein